MKNPVSCKLVGTRYELIRTMQLIQEITLQIWTVMRMKDEE